MKLSQTMLVAVLVVAAWVPASAQSRRISAKDGDTVVVDGTAGIRIVRRSAATVRAIYNPTQHWLVILADVAAPNGAGDGGVDVSYTFQDVADWPAGERWEGETTIEEYSVAGEMGSSGLTLHSRGGCCRCSTAARGRSSETPRRLR